MDDFNSTDHLNVAPAVIDTPSVLAAPLSDEETRWLDAGFDEEAAAEIERTLTAAPETVKAIQTTVPLKELGNRVILLHTVFDDTPSMAGIISMARAACDRCLDTVQRIMEDEPGDVLASLSWLNGGVHYGYTPIAEAPRFGTTSRIELRGMTAWRDAYATAVAATAQQMDDLEAENKVSNGMVGLVTDGLDNASTKHSPASLAAIIRNFRRLETLVMYAMYTGKLYQPTDIEYNGEYRMIANQLTRMGIHNPIEVALANIQAALNIEEQLTEYNVHTYTQGTNYDLLKELILMVFTSVGLDPKLVFLPGDSPRAVMEAFVTVSKLAKDVSVLGKPRMEMTSLD